MLMIQPHLGLVVLWVGHDPAEHPDLPGELLGHLVLPLVHLLPVVEHHRGVRSSLASKVTVVRGAGSRKTVEDIVGPGSGREGWVELELGPLVLEGGDHGVAGLGVKLLVMVDRQIAQ